MDGRVFFEEKLMRPKLYAINSCLAGVGIAPVSDESNVDTDVAGASITIDRISREIQERGWWFNKEHNWVLVPNNYTGQVAAPTNALSIVTDDYSRGLNIVLREGRLYDMVNHTYDLRPVANYKVNEVMTIQATFIMHLSFEDLPSIAQTAETYVSRRQFAQDLEVDEKRWKFQKEDEVKAMNNLMREDMRNKKLNMISGNASIQLFMSKVGGRNSLSNGVSIFPRRQT